ncbi:MAG: PIG-L family deacetylase [Desulfovibrio sp.]|nr:PIG-L family deacetylase [Desulfovibrio sp.]
MNVLFLFAHQDDEYGIFARLHEHCRRGDNVCCAYLTDGGPLARVRKQESLAVLATLGLSPGQVYFPGMEHGWQDGKLHTNFADCCRWLAHLLLDFAPQEAYIPAWEGGHPDHDIVHAVACACASHLGTPLRIWQFPLYNGYACAGPLFRAMLPLPGNGAVLRQSIPVTLRVRYARLCLRYPSQRKTWLGLFLPVALRYVFGGAQQLQIAVPDRLKRPHAGKLYYERRGFCTWETINAAIRDDPFRGEP